MGQSACVLAWLDGFAEWLRHRLGVQNQLRMGVLMVMGSVPLLLWGFFTDEPFLVYQMSAAALLFGGIGVVVTAETLNEVAEDVDGIGGVRRCESCGQPLPEASGQVAGSG